MGKGVVEEQAGLQCCSKRPPGVDQYTPLPITVRVSHERSAKWGSSSGQHGPDEASLDHPHEDGPGHHEHTCWTRIKCSCLSLHCR